MITRLLEKGVAIHHSGIMPIFREMIELLFAKGYIKLLFATETFAVGINMPTKTVLFTGFDKFNGSSMRMLYPHEYTQMAGRAGRRGLDTIGHVIHLNNMFNLPYSHDYEQMVNGNPQTLQSKFSISYNLVLNFLQFNNNTIDFADKSMSNGEIQRMITGVSEHITKLKSELRDKEINPSYKYIMDNMELFTNYLQMREDVKTCKQKARKQMERSISEIESGNKQFKTQLEQYKSLLKMKSEIKENEEYMESLKLHFHSSFNNIVQFLQNYDYVKEQEQEHSDNDDNTNNSKIVIQEKGGVATFIQETHCLAFTDFLIKENYLKKYNSYEIAALLSCFANIRVKEEQKIHNISYLTANAELNETLQSLASIYDNYSDEELRCGLSQSNNLEYLFEFVNSILDWCEAEDESTCKTIMKKCEFEYETFPGEFIKAILKINNMVNELKNVAEYMGNVELLHKLTTIPELTLKFVATNQSLYV
jgi:superfamily II RNA helicase